ncbi:MAG: roadblock/LC7 domain-containing protein [Deltaproteobacteria bacterium]|nr:roadblock/LC7 domain-containing protein [Deltaproteobacteria bacterium]
MKRILDELCEMEGINGVFICNDDGDLIEFSSPRDFDAITLSQTATVAARAAETISVQHHTWDCLVAHFAEGKLIFSKFSQCLLCAIAEPSSNVAFLNVAIKVARNKIQRKLESSNIAAATMRPNSEFGLGGQIYADGAIGTAGSMAAGQAVAAHGMYSTGLIENWTGSDHRMENFDLSDAGSGVMGYGPGEASVSSTSVRVADNATSNTLNRVAEALAELVGPKAHALVLEAMQKVCPSQPFSKNHLKPLQKTIEKEYIAGWKDLRQFRKSLQR